MKTIDRLILAFLAFGMFMLAAVQFASTKQASAYHGLSRHDVELAVRNGIRDLQARMQQQPDTTQAVRSVLQNCTLIGNFVENEESEDSTDFIARLSC